MTSRRFLSGTGQRGRQEALIRAAVASSIAATEEAKPGGGVLVVAREAGVVAGDADEGGVAAGEAGVVPGDGGTVASEDGWSLASVVRVVGGGAAAAVNGTSEPLATGSVISMPGSPYEHVLVRSTMAARKASREGAAPDRRSVRRRGWMVMRAGWLPVIRG